jgi:hypothetical protein
VESGVGLGVGGDVRLLGFNVGKISKVEALSAEDIIYGDYGNVYIEFYVLDPYQGYIWSDSHVEVIAGDFLGGRILQITPGGATLSTNKEAKLNASYKFINGKPHVYDDKAGDYKIFDDKSKGYTLLAKESVAVTEQLQQVANQVQGALPGILDLTNRVNLVLSNVASLTAEAKSLLANAGPALSNVTVITDNLKNPKGSLGEWVLPTNLNSQLLVTLTSANDTLTNATKIIANTDTNMSTLVTNISDTLINLADLTSNLNQQVQSNTNLVKGLSDLITNADDMVQGLKRHWLLRSAFKNKSEEEKESSERPKSPTPKAGKWRN